MGVKSNEQEFSTLEEAKMKCMELLADDCGSVEEYRKGDNSKTYFLKRWGLINLNYNSKYTSYMRPKSSQDGWCRSLFDFKINGLNFRIGLEWGNECRFDTFNSRILEQ